MQLAEERAPDGFDDLHAVIRPDELAAIAEQYKMVADLTNTPSTNACRSTRPSKWPSNLKAADCISHVCGVGDGASGPGQLHRFGVWKAAAIRR